MASLEVIATEAARQGVLDRVVVGHADLGRAEWAGTRELAREQAERYGLRFFVVTATGPDLLERVRAAGDVAEPPAALVHLGPEARALRRLMTQLVREHRDRFGEHPVRLLNVMGMRAQESPARAKRDALRVDPSASNGRREVSDFLPLHEWSVEEVWEWVHASRIADLIHPPTRPGCRGSAAASASSLRSRRWCSRLALTPSSPRSTYGSSRPPATASAWDCSIAEVIEAARTGELVAAGSWSG